MKTLVIYYSFTGHSREIAQALAAGEAADIAEVRDTKPFGKAKAYSTGCLAAIRGKAWPILPLEVDPAAYDRLIICAPVWADNPPPAVNALIEQLPQGKIVAVKMVATSGKSNCEQRWAAAITAVGGTLESFESIKA